MNATDVDFPPRLPLLPSDETALLRRGINRFQQGDHQGALRDFECCTESNPNLVEAWNNVGLLLMLLGRPAEALRPLNQAIDRKADYPEALINRGRVRQMLNDSDDALEDLNRAVAIARGSLLNQALMLRAGVCHKRGDHDSVRRDLDRVLELSPNDPGALLHRGNLRREAGDFVGAIEDLDRALELSPPSRRAFAHYCRGAARLYLRRYAASIEDFDAAIALEPDNAVFYVARGNARYHRCDRRSVMDYFLGLRLNQRKAGSEIVRLVREHAQINVEEVLENCARHLEVNPSDLIALLRRGLTYRIVGRHTEADDAMASAMVLRPDYVELIRYLDAVASGQEECVPTGGLPSCGAIPGG